MKDWEAGWIAGWEARYDNNRVLSRYEIKDKAHRANLARLAYAAAKGARMRSRLMPREMPDTKAGRALLDELPSLVRGGWSIFRREQYAIRLRAIEREAAQQGVAEGAAQERERIRAAFLTLPRHEKQHGDYPEVFVKANDFHAILAEPSE